jgi:hypothetical protein
MIRHFAILILQAEKCATLLKSCSLIESSSPGDASTNHSVSAFRSLVAVPDD